MAKLTDFRIANEDTTEIEQYEFGDYTVIVEWDGESKVYFVFHEADLVTETSSWPEVERTIGTDFTEDAFRTLDVTYMERVQQ